MKVDSRKPCITAFGSSRIAEHEAIFTDVEVLATRLAEQGYDGMTGGHQGMMAAFSRGIHAGGGHVRGVTLERFPTPPGNTLSEETRAHDFFDRMQTLIEEADAYLVLPGGLGTLAELAMTWDLLAIRVLEPRPIIVYGEMWQPLLNACKESLILSVDNAFSQLRLCTTHDDVLSALQQR